MRKIKTLICMLVIAVSGFSMYSEDLTSAEVSAIQKVMDSRLKIRNYENIDDALKFLNEDQKNFEASSEYKALGNEARLIVENMYILEKYSCMYQKNMKSPELKPYILAQYDKINEYKDSNEGKDFSPYFILSSGDVINSSMQFIPQSLAIKQGLREKDEYDKLVNENPKLSFGFINRGLWYYFAPSIGGGSKSVGKTDFQKAVECAACDYEKFYSRIYLSQVYFDEGDKSKAASLLSECDNILPGNVYTSFIRKLNANNYSLLYYTNNREKVDKKLGL